MATIRAVASDPERGPRIVQVENTLAAFRAAVPGAELLEAHMGVIGGKAHVVYCDEEGLIKGLDPSVADPLGLVWIRGPVLITDADEEGGDVSLTEEDARSIVGSCRAASYGGRGLKVLVTGPMPVFPTGLVDLGAAE